MQHVVVHSVGYEIMRNLFKHWDRFPVPHEATWQDDVQRLRFVRHGRELELVMNLGYLRDRTIPCALICDGRDDCKQHDLLDQDFLAELEVLLESFQPPPVQHIDD
jgi:hypothetical protein